MAKGDDALAKKKNKQIRKRNRRAGAGTTEAIEGVQSHKRRRKAGTRRVCETMCYSLPTLEDPFNDKKKFKKRRIALQEEESAQRFEDRSKAFVNDYPTSYRGQKIEKLEKRGSSETSIGQHERGDMDRVAGERSKNHINGLSKSYTVKGNRNHVMGVLTKPLKCVVWNPTIEASSLGNGNTVTEDYAYQSAFSAIFVPRVAEHRCSEQAQLSPDVSGFERQLWQACSQGVDVLGVGRGPSCVQAYVVAAAPHIAAYRNGHGSIQEPVALFLVNSKERALSVRQVCKPLKRALNIHSVSLHSGTPMEHHVDGLAVQMPDILVSTPDRLCHLLDVHALKLTSVSFVVVDALDDLVGGGFHEQMDIIRQQLRPGVQVVVLSDTFPLEVINTTRRWLHDPIARAASDDSVPACSACITQTVSVVTKEDVKLSKFKKILEQVSKNQEENQIRGHVLLLVNTTDHVPAVTELLLKHGFFPHLVSKTIPASSNKRRVVLIAKFDEFIEMQLLSGVEVLINYDFSWPAQQYVRFLTAMARTTVKGRVETLCSGAAALQANALVDILQHSWQPVPRPLLLLAQAASLLQQ